MESLSQAQARLIDSLTPIDGIESVSLVEACGRVLAADVVAPVDVPPADVSLFDGYALAAPVTMGDRLPVVGEQYAGDGPTQLEAGAAMRIFTGAVVPAGANAVIAQEFADRTGDEILIQEALEPGAGIRRQGADSRTGATVLHRGERLGVGHIGLLGSVGQAEVSVIRRPRVALFTTGDELVEPGQPLPPGKIFNANHAMLRVALERLGAEVLDLGRLADNADVLTEALTQAASKADLVLTSGGVSVGEADLVRGVVERLGGIDHWRVFLKPGKPLAYGRIGSTPFIGLPGNPVSTFVTYCLFVRPALLTLQGADAGVARPAVRVPVDFAHRGGDRPEFIRVRRDACDGEPRLSRFSDQNSGLLSSIAWADGVALVPPETELHPGDVLEYFPFAEWL